MEKSKQKLKGKKLKKSPQDRAVRDGEDRRIGRLDEQTLGYYRRVLETLDNGFEDQEEKDIFIDNVVKQLSAEVIEVSQNQSVSNIVERLITECNADQVKEIFHNIAKNWETACCDRFASHVTQVLVIQVGNIVTSSSFTQDETKKILETDVCNLWNFLQSSIGMYMQHTYASHVLRALIEVLGAVHVGVDIIRSQLSQQFKKNSKFVQQKPELNVTCEAKLENLDLLREFTKKIIGFPKLQDYMTHPLSSPVIQTLLLVLKKRTPELCEELCRSVLPFCFQIEDDQFTGLVADSIGSRLVEQVLTICSEKVFEEIFNDYIKENVENLGLHKTANFVLQKILVVCNKEQFEVLYKKLHSIIEDLLAHNHLGVVIKLVEGAVAHCSKQDKLLKVIMKAFHCYKPEERQSKIFPLLASLTTYDVFYKLPEDKEVDDEKGSNSDTDDEEIVMPVLKDINLHGSILLQKLLLFANPRIIVQSLFELSQTELNFMICDAKGSHIIDAFLASDTVGDKSRDQMYKKFQGCYISIACSKCGSRALESLWQKASLKQKTMIAEELAKQQDKVRGHSFGKFVWRNFALDVFVKRRQDWQGLQTGTARKREMFKDIIEGDKRQTTDTISKFNRSSISKEPKRKVPEVEAEFYNPNKRRKDSFTGKSEEHSVSAARKTKNRYQVKDKTMVQLLDQIKPKPKKKFKNKKQQR